MTALAVRITPPNDCNAVDERVAAAPAFVEHAAPASPEFLTEQEAAELLRCSPFTLRNRRLALDPVAPFRRVGRRILYRRDDL